MGVVQAARFDIFKEPHYLLLMVAAMTSASLHDMGMCHVVKRNLGGRTEVVEVCWNEEERVRALERWFGVVLTEEEREGIRGLPTELIEPKATEE